MSFFVEITCVFQTPVAQVDRLRDEVIGNTDLKWLPVIIRLSPRPLSSKALAGDTLTTGHGLGKVIWVTVWVSIRVASTLIPKTEDYTTSRIIHLLDSTVPKAVTVGRKVCDGRRCKRHNPLEPPCRL